MLKLIFVVCVLSAVGCGKSGPCVQRSGTYAVKFSEHSGGTCGALPEQTVTLSEGAAPAGCTGTSSASPDNCGVTLANITCPGANGYTVIENGKADWSEDGKSASAVITLNIIENDTGTGYCSSTYDASYSKL